MKRLIDASLVRAEGTASLKDQDNLSGNVRRGVRPAILFQFAAIGREE